MPTHAAADCNMRTHRYLATLGCMLLCCFYFPAQAGVAQSTARARGALLFMNYCNGCHSLSYLAWERMEKDLQLSSMSSLQISDRLLLTLPNADQKWPNIAIASGDAQHWFGKFPPDLSLSERLRGKRWIRQYLAGFYPDHTKTFGVNNHLLLNTKMPNVLESLQHDLNPQEFQVAIADIAAFLEYASDPSIVMRKKLGSFVIVFLALFSLLLWLKFRKLH